MGPAIEAGLTLPFGAATAYMRQLLESICANGGPFSTDRAPSLLPIEHTQIVITNHDGQLVVLCSQKYTLSPAGAALQDIEPWRAAERVGGFQPRKITGPPVMRQTGLLSVHPSARTGLTVLPRPDASRGVPLPLYVDCLIKSGM
jgi:hypothetical protein